MNDVTALRLLAVPTLSRQPEGEQKGGTVTRKAGGGDRWGCGRWRARSPCTWRWKQFSLIPVAQDGNQDQQARTLGRLGAWQLQVGSSRKPWGAMGG